MYTSYNNIVISSYLSLVNIHMRYKIKIPVYQTSCLIYDYYYFIIITIIIIDYYYYCSDTIYIYILRCIRYQISQWIEQ
jgi:hypothetical protein